MLERAARAPSAPLSPTPLLARRPPLLPRPPLSAAGEETKVLRAGDSAAAARTLLGLPVTLASPRVCACVCVRARACFLTKGILPSID
jgi:hypothetical protein